MNNQDYKKEITKFLLNLPHKYVVSFALYCAEDVYSLVNDKDKIIVRNCLDKIYLWLNGKASTEEVKAAADAAYAAIGAYTAYAADAAIDAVDAAIYAAYTTNAAAYATNAADAAYAAIGAYTAYAADAAIDAAYATNVDAAIDAAYATNVDAAIDAAVYTAHVAHVAYTTDAAIKVNKYEQYLTELKRICNNITDLEKLIWRLNC